MKNKNPKYALVAITYRCNSRCRMCNIWKKEEGFEMKAEDYKKLPQGLEDINITGGEPFLRNDLAEIIEVIFENVKPGRLVISSNGFLTGRIVDFAKGLKGKEYKDKITLAFSLDAIGEKHGEIRGVPEAYDKVMATIHGLKQIGFNNIGIGYTFMAGNEKEYGKVFDLAKKENLNFGATIAHNSDNYFSTQANAAPDSKVIEQEVEKNIKEKIKSFSKNELGKCYYMHGLAEYAKTSRPLHPCDALSSSFFLDPEGNIFPCNILSDKAGNLRNADFNTLWNSEAAEKIRMKVKKCPSPCWMVCTAKPAIKREWMKAGWWIFKEKVKNIFRAAD